jgi:hypothetical protein
MFFNTWQSSNCVSRIRGMGLIERYGNLSPRWKGRFDTVIVLAFVAPTVVAIALRLGIDPAQDAVGKNIDTRIRASSIDTIFGSEKTAERRFEDFSRQVGFGDVQSVEIDGKRAYYLYRKALNNSKKTIILLPGQPGFNDSIGITARKLAEEYNIIAISVPNQTFSSTAEQFEAHTQIVRNLIQKHELDSKEISVIGESISSFASLYLVKIGLVDNALLVRPAVSIRALCEKFLPKDVNVKAVGINKNIQPCSPVDRVYGSDLKTFLNDPGINKKTKVILGRRDSFIGFKLQQNAFKSLFITDLITDDGDHFNNPEWLILNEFIYRNTLDPNGRIRDVIENSTTA